MLVFVIARSNATKQSMLSSWRDGLLRSARNDGGKLSQAFENSRLIVGDASVIIEA
jgi:hypothetical protein